MKCKEKFNGSKKEGIHYLNSLFTKLFKGELQLDGEEVFLPNGEELDYTAKFEYDEEYGYGAFGLKISWGEEPEYEDEYEEEYEGDEEEYEEEIFIKNPKDYYL